MNSSFMRRRVLLVFVGIVVCQMMALAAAQAEPATITHLFFGSAGKAHEDFLVKMAAKFEAQYPQYRIELINGGSGAVYLDRILVASAAGVPYDVIEPTTTDFSAVARAGLVRDLAPLAARDGVDWNVFVPYAIAPYKWDDRVLALPTEISAVTTISNVDLLGEAGLATPGQLGSAWDWERLLSYGAYLSWKDPDGKPVRWAYMAGTAMHRVVPMMVHNAGGDIFDKVMHPTKATFTTDPAVEVGLSFYLDLWTRGYIVTNRNEFANKHTAAISFNEGPWWIGMAETSSAPFEYEVALFPRGPARQGNEVLANAYSIHQYSTQLEGAWQWIKFLTLDYDNVVEYMKMSGRPAAYLPAMPQFARLFPGHPGSIAVFLEVLQRPDSRIRTVSPVYTDVYNKFNADFPGLVLTQKQPLKTFLENMQTFTQQKLDEHWAGM